MNDIIKLLLYNILFLILIYYNNKLSIFFVIFLMIIYSINIYSNLRNKLVEGQDLYLRNIFYMPESSDKYEYGAVLPNSIEYNSDYGKFSTMYSFYKGQGNKNILKSSNTPIYDKTNKLLDDVLNMLKEKKNKCNGEFKKGKCSRECGLGVQEVIYKTSSELVDSNKCEYKDGYKYEEECYLRGCDLDEKCSDDNDCNTGHCEEGLCTTVFKCDKGVYLENCRNKEKCLELNKKYKDDKFKYEWDGEKCQDKDKKEYKGEYDDMKDTKKQNVKGLEIDEVKGEFIGDGPTTTTTTTTTTSPSTTSTLGSTTYQTSTSLSNECIDVVNLRNGGDNVSQCNIDGGWMQDDAIDCSQSYFYDYDNNKYYYCKWFGEGWGCDKSTNQVPSNCVNSLQNIKEVE
jgi:hypothetical protein